MEIFQLGHQRDDSSLLINLNTAEDTAVFKVPENAIFVSYGSLLSHKEWVMKSLASSYDLIEAGFLQDRDDFDSAFFLEPDKHTLHYLSRIAYLIRSNPNRSLQEYETGHPSAFPEFNLPAAIIVTYLDNYLA